MKTTAKCTTELLAPLLEKHGSQNPVTSASGFLAIRDRTQKLWFYYEFRNGDYQVTGSTRTHPKFN